MGQWRRFTVITWSDSNCNAPRTRRDAESVREDYQAGALLVMRILANSVWGQWTGGSTGPGMRLTQY
jgi:hypothetical protein